MAAFSVMKITMVTINETAINQVKFNDNNELTFTVSLPEPQQICYASKVEIMAARQFIRECVAVYGKYIEYAVTKRKNNCFDILIANLGEAQQDSHRRIWYKDRRHFSVNAYKAMENILNDAQRGEYWQTVQSRGHCIQILKALATYSDIPEIIEKEGKTYRFEDVVDYLTEKIICS